MVDEPFLVGTSGTPSFSLPSSFHLFTRHLNVSGIDWVEGLKKLSLNSIEIRPPISVAIVEEPPIGSVLELVLQDSVHSPTESSDSVISCALAPKVVLEDWGETLWPMLGGGAELHT